MARRNDNDDPLRFIPSPEVIRDELRKAETRAERLRVLLEVAERIRQVGDQAREAVASQKVW
jgi:hypothetical protein